MNELSPMSDLIADDLFLDRLAGRVDAGSDPLAGLLGALAAQADTPLPSRTGRRRVANKHRYFGAFAALAVAASGAGVAAAVTLPSNGPSQAERARIVRLMDDSARNDAPSAFLTRLGLPQTSGTGLAKGLVLARRDDGTIVLLPAATVAAQQRAAAAAGVVTGAGGDGRVGNGEPGDGQDGNTGTGNGLANGQAGNGQGGDGQGATAGSEAGGTAGQGGDEGDQGGGAQTGTPPATRDGKKPTPGPGTKKPTPTSTPTPTPTGTTESVAPQTMLAPLTTSTSKARSTGTSPTSPTPPPRRTPAPQAATGAADPADTADGWTDGSVTRDAPHGGVVPSGWPVLPAHVPAVVPALVLGVVPAS